MQSGRGAAGSGGTLDPFQQEYDDGLATLEWLKQQDWFNGEMVVAGASYAGFTAWATACAAGPLLKAIREYHALAQAGHRSYLAIGP
jgi:uncharacterized protein